MCCLPNIGGGAAADAASKLFVTSVSLHVILLFGNMNLLEFPLRWQPGTNDSEAPWPELVAGTGTDLTNKQYYFILSKGVSIYAKKIVAVHLSCCCCCLSKKERLVSTKSV